MPRLRHIPPDLPHVNIHHLHRLQRSAEIWVDPADQLTQQLGAVTNSQSKGQASIEALLKRVENAEGEVNALNNRVQALETAVACADRRSETLDCMQRSAQMVFFGVCKN